MKVERLSEQQMYKLVEIYKEYECLWDVSNEFYKNREVRNNAYEEILEKLNVPGLKVRDIPQKIKNLRTSYYTELRKIEAGGKKGREKYKTKLAWFSIADEMLRTTSRSQHVHSETESEPELNTKKTHDTQKIITTLNAKKTERDSTQKTIRTLDKIANKVTPSTTTNRNEPQIKYEDEYDSFGKYISSSLRSMSREMSIIAKMELQKTMADVQLKDIRQKKLVLQPAVCGPSTFKMEEDPLRDPLDLLKVRSETDISLSNVKTNQEFS